MHRTQTIPSRGNNASIRTHANNTNKLTNKTHKLTINKTTGSTEDGGGPGGVFSLQELNYLRRFDNLRLLVLDGNDIAKNPNYKNFVVAHIKKLMYLDFRLVDEVCVYGSVGESHSK